MTAVEAAASAAGGLLEPTGEAAAAASVRRVGIGVGKGGIRKKRCRNAKAAKRPCEVRREVPMSLQLQRLFQACRQVFKGPGTVPSQTDVEKLCQILGEWLNYPELIYIIKPNYCVFFFVSFRLFDLII